MLGHRKEVEDISIALSDHKSVIVVFSPMKSVIEVISPWNSVGKSLEGHHAFLKMEFTKIIIYVFP